MVKELTELSDTWDTNRVEDVYNSALLILDPTGTKLNLLNWPSFEVQEYDTRQEENSLVQRTEECKSWLSLGKNHFDVEMETYYSEQRKVEVWQMTEWQVTNQLGPDVLMIKILTQCVTHTTPVVLLA